MVTRSAARATGADTSRSTSARGRLMAGPYASGRARSHRKIGRCATISDRHERMVRRRRQLDPDGVTGSHLATRHDHAHDPGLADELPPLAPERRGHEAGLYPVELNARVAEAGH